MYRSKFTLTLELLQKRLTLPGRLLEIRIDHKNGIAEIIFINTKFTQEGAEAEEEEIDLSSWKRKE